MTLVIRSLSFYCINLITKLIRLAARAQPQSPIFQTYMASLCQITDTIQPMAQPKKHTTKSQNKISKISITFPPG